jgi:hypothetical protein
MSDDISFDDEQLQQQPEADGFPGHACCVKFHDLRCGKIPIGLVSLLSLLLLMSVAVALSQTILDERFFSMSVQAWLSWLLSFVPLTFVVLCLSFPHLRKRFVGWKNGLRRFLLPGLISLCWLIGAVVMLKYDPLAHVYVTVICVASVEAVRMGRKQSPSSNWIDLFVGTLLFAMLDLRWVGQHLYMGENSYNFFAVAFSLLVISAWIVDDVYEGFSLSLNPHWKDLLFAIGCLVAEVRQNVHHFVFLCFLVLAALIIPVGLLSGFLRFPPKWIGSASAGEVLLMIAAGAMDNFMTTALPEELFFRGLLYNGVRHHTGDSKRGKAIAIGVSSIAFGLMHWVRERDLLTKVLYTVFATYAGALYCVCYVLAGNSMVASIVAHVLTDVIWGVLFK